MASIKIEDIVIPVFDGVGYQSWRKRMIKFLEFKKCKNVAIRRKASSDKAEDWTEADIKATNYIYGAISNKQLEYIAELDTAFSIINKFDEMYLKESTALQIVRRNKLENIKLSNYTEVHKFFNDFKKAVNELKAAGAAVTEQEKLRYMLKALPSNYSHIGDLIDVMPEVERTVEYLKSKIQLKTIEEKNQTKEEETANNSINKSNVFVTETKENCFQCGKPGHFKKDCYYKNSNFTGQLGRSNTQRGWSRGRLYQRGNFRGRSANRGNYRNNFRGSYRGAANTTTTRDVFNTQVNASQLEHKQVVVSANQINWLLDSGCTDHIINNDQLFYNYVELKKPVEVKLGDGKDSKQLNLEILLCNLKHLIIKILSPYLMSFM